MRSVVRFALLLTALALGPRLASATTISILPPDQTAVIGDQFALDIVISDLIAGLAPSLGVFDIDLTFDPAIVSFTNVNWGNQLDLFGLGSLRAATPGMGFVNLFELSLDSAADLNALQGANFLLATVLFNGIELGVSDIGLVVNALGDAQGTALSSTVEPGAVVVAPVPEPATILLLMTGGAILFGSRRRSKGTPPGR